jgi:hypothetical protein
MPYPLPFSFFIWGSTGVSPVVSHILLITSGHRTRGSIFRYIYSIMSYDLNADVNSSSVFSCYFTVIIIHRLYISSVLLN